MLTLSTRASFREYMDVLGKRIPFRTHGALSASVFTLSPPTAFGRLPEEYRRSVRQADYVVFSYGTPIAWHMDGTGQWVMPDESYSATTTRHQNKIRVALAELGWA